MATTFLAFMGTTELIIILVIVVLVFGVGKLPQVGKQLGEGIKNFKKEMNEPDDDGPADQLPPAQEPPFAPRDVTEEHKQNAP